MAANTERREDATQLRRFVDDLRAYLDLPPLYLMNNTVSREEICQDALTEGPTSISNMALRVFGDASGKSCYYVSAVMRKFRRKGIARMIKPGWWEAA